MQRIPLASFWTRYHNKPFDQSELGQALKRLPSVAKHGPWLAGGAVRRTIQGDSLDSDFDFFFASADQFAAFVKELESRGAIKERETDFNITFRMPAADKLPELKVQAIRASYHHALETMLETFDFSLCQTGYDGTDFVFGPYTLYDLARRRLLKYTRQGYTVCNGGLAHLLKQVVDDPSIINQNIVSID